MLDSLSLRALIEQELRADRVHDDVTSRLLRPEWAKATVYSREQGIFSGEAVCRAFPGIVKLTCLAAEGSKVENGTPIAEMLGMAGDCLSVERTLLNLLSHLSGVASLTHKFVEAVRPYPVKVLATRKTLPLLRDLQLQAVRAGGGFIHRRSLSDGILVKDNHLVFVAESEVVAKAKAGRSPLHRVEVEVQSLAQLERLLVDPPDLIMLDNFSLDDTRAAVERIRGVCEIEASGGMDLAKARLVASLGVQYISVGSLTHSAPALNFSLDIVRSSK
jgi:nicotinate-nucleotide pyrophosphorylase (carboxylating)